MFFWTGSKAKVNEVALSTLEATGIWIVVTAGWVFSFLLKKKLSKLKSKNNENFKNMLWLCPKILFFWCAVQLCDGQSARVITVNSSIVSREREKVLVSLLANHNKKWHLPFVLSVIAWTVKIFFITPCPDLQQKQMNFFQEDFKCNMVIKIVSIL